MDSTQIEQDVLVQKFREHEVKIPSCTVFNRLWPRGAMPGNDFPTKIGTKCLARQLPFRFRDIENSFRIFENVPTSDVPIQSFLEPAKRNYETTGCSMPWA
jgi:hypothetical protein